MNKHHFTTTALAAFLVLALSASAFAWHGHGKHGNGQSGCQNDQWSQLTPEKRAAVEAIQDKYQAKLDTLRTQMWTKHATLQAMVNGGNADEKKIARLTKEMTTLRDQMRETRTDMHAELEKETGLTGFGGYGPGGCSGYGQSHRMGGGQGGGPCGSQGRSMGPCAAY